MFDKIFKYHYSKKYAYVLDGICLLLAIEILLYLNGSNLVIRSFQDKIVFHQFGDLQYYLESA